MKKNDTFYKECVKRGIGIEYASHNNTIYLKIKEYNNMDILVKHSNIKISDIYKSMYTLSNYPDDLYDISEVPDYEPNMNTLTERTRIKLYQTSTGIYVGKYCMREISKRS